jgi:predicted transcriptional regulator
MKTAISLPDAVFENAEQLARQMQVSRSYLYTLAIKDFIDKCRQDSVTETLNTLYSKEDSKIDPFVQRANQMLLGHEEW